MSSSLADIAPAAPAARKRWTVEDYLQMPDDGRRYELYRGELIEMASPSLIHQRLVGEIYTLLRAFVREHRLGEVVLSPMDVFLDVENTAQPDVLFISNERAHIAGQRVNSAPDLAVEILSPSSIRRDRYEKLDLYAEFGVREYWIIDPANRSVEILSFRGARPTVDASAVGTGKVASTLLAGLEVDLADLFQSPV